MLEDTYCNNLCLIKADNLFTIKLRLSCITVNIYRKTKKVKRYVQFISRVYFLIVNSYQ